MAAARPSIQVDVTSDTVCPWCYVGKMNIERAIEEVKDEFDVQVGMLSPKMNEGERKVLSGEHSSAGHVEKSAVHICWVDNWTDEGGLDREINLTIL